MHDDNTIYGDMVFPGNVDITGDLAVSSDVTVNGTLYTDTIIEKTANAGITLDSFVVLKDGGTLTINAGAITITNSNHQVDTEGSAASDDLDTINGGSSGTLLILRSYTNARDTTLKDGTDNLRLAGDFTLSNSQDTIMLIRVGSYWYELSRSDNA
jgi:hypothetical protein